MKACFQIAECCLSYANIAFLSEKNISFKYYYKKIRGFHYVFLQKVRGFLCAFYKKVRGFDKNIETKCTQPSEGLRSQTSRGHEGYIGTMLVIENESMFHIALITIGMDMMMTETMVQESLSKKNLFQNKDLSLVSLHIALPLIGFLGNITMLPHISYNILTV